MDNLGVLNRLAFGQASSLKRNSDVIREIQSVQTSLQFPIYRHSVRSHQNDTIVDLSDLPFPTQVNKIFNTPCTLAHDCESCRPPTTPPVFPSVTACLLIDGKPQSSKIDIDLRHSYQVRQLRTHITERKEWAPATFQLVHWLTIQTCMYRSTDHQKRAAIKLFFRQCGKPTTNYTSAPKAMTVDANVVVVTLRNLIISSSAIRAS